MSSSPPPRSEAFDDLVSETERHALQQEAVYAAPRIRTAPRRARIALAVALPVLALVVLWNVRLQESRPLPPPEIEAVDLARTLRIAVDEVESFRLRRGRLPEPGEARDLLPEGASLRRFDDGYELVLSAPVVDRLHYRSAEDPDEWLAAVRAALEPVGS